ncbi:MAG: excisionase family DNA-binding protein [Treponema sp.]|jgi:excisionase family DNA binding protein|nr:excisionase family DNA-binding protein [Treponema sp.]
MPNQFYTVRQMADALNESYLTVFRKVTDKEFPSIRLGRKILIPASFLKELEEKAKAEKAEA